MAVLIVEDNAVLAKTIGRAVRGIGRRAEWVATLADATCRLKSGGISAICLDLQLPDGDGLDWMSASRIHLPVFVITGADCPHNQERARRLGVSDYFAKPFALSQLCQSISHRIGPDLTFLPNVSTPDEGSDTAAGSST